MKYEVVILEQYGKLAGGQTVGQQLFDLLSPKLSCRIFAPMGTWSQTMTNKSVTIIDLKMSRLRENVRIIRQVLAPHGMIIINGPRSALLGLILKAFHPRASLIYYLHNRPSKKWMRLLTYAISLFASRRVSVAQCIAPLLWRPEVLHNCAREEVRLDRGVVVSALAEHEPAKVPVIKFMGRADPVKGLDVLRDALVLLSQREDLPKWRAEIAVGEGLHTQLDEVGVLELGNVGFVGKKDATWLMPGDILCVPSRFEASPLVVQEAMMRGVCVVASDAWGLKEVINASTGFTFESGSPVALAETLAIALKSPDKRISISLSAHSQGLQNISDWERYWLAVVDLFFGNKHAKTP